jgi:hypothetical protein
MNGGCDRDDIRAEFAALRQEILSTINGRGGGITCIALAGGDTALYERTTSTYFFVVLVFAGMAFCAEALWYLNGAYTKSKSYDETFQEIREDRTKARALTPSVQMRGVRVEGREHDEPRYEQSV